MIFGIKFHYRTGMRCVGFLLIYIICLLPKDVTAQSEKHFLSTSRLSRKQLQHLKDSGLIDFYRPLNAGTFVVRVVSPLENDSVFNVISDNEWKKSPGFANGIPTRMAIQVLDTKRFLSTISGESVEVVSIDTLSNVVLLDITDSASLHAIVEDNDVVFVSPATRPVVETPNSFQDLSVNRFNLVHHHSPELSGDNYNVSVKERSIDTTDIDLRQRYFTTPLKDEIISLHANQMATIIAGAGNSIPSSKGVVWQANVTSSSFLNPFPDPDLADFNISVQNHSYGTGIQNFYGPEAHAYDVAAVSIDSIIHIFSAGNSGLTVSDHGYYKDVNGFANITGTMKMAKNVLVVGGHNILLGTDDRNSSGPAYDGRLVPSVSAFGPEGTSDAAAFVSGLAVQIQQAVKLKDGSLPKIDLIKAVMAVSCDDIGKAGVDYNTGYGAVNAQSAIDVITNDQYSRQTVEKNETFIKQVEIPPGVKLFKLAINWIDPSVDAGSPIALVNDLDLSITHTETGNRWLPWVLSSYPHPDSLAKPARRSEDHLNNTEFITIANPAAGMYQLQVDGHGISSPDQTFAIAFSLEKNDIFQWTYPTGSDAIDVSDSVIFRWDTGYTGQGVLEVSVNNEPYTALSTTVDLEDEYYVWKTNLTLGTVKARMIIGENTFDGDEVAFNTPLIIKVGFVCEESFMISWTDIDQAEMYNLYILDGNYMQVLTSLTDTVWINSTSNNPYYAIAPVIDGLEGVRSAAYNIFTQGVSCFYQSFSASQYQIGVAELSLSLSTSYSVKEIIWEKNLAGSYVEIGQSSTTDELNYTFLDKDLQTGVTLYRARIILEDGTQITTNEGAVYGVDETSYFVFPNPIEQGADELTLLTDGSLIDFFLLDAQGRVVKTEHLVNYLIRINLDAFESGMYYYQFRRKGKAVGSGKIIIR